MVRDRAAEFGSRGVSVDDPGNVTAAAALEVLFVDDDQDTRRLVRLQLHAVGFNVITAKNGNEALELFEALQFDVVVTDIFMPISDGIELIQELRRRHPRLPIVA